MARSKNHHYVPQVLQRRFLAKGQAIWFSERRAGLEFSRPALRNIEKAFRRRNHYTIIEGGALSDVVEREHYGPIDDYLGRLLSEVDELESRDGKLPRFGGQPLKDLRHCVVELLKRTPDLTDRYDDEETGRKLISSTISDFGADVEPNEVHDLEQIIRDPEQLRHLGRDIRVRAAIGPSKKISDALTKFVARWGVISGKHSFILSSQMACRISIEGNTALDSESLEIWLPVSPKRALILLHERKSHVPNQVEVPRDMCRAINQHAMASSQEIGSHSQKLLESLTGKIAEA